MKIDRRAFLKTSALAAMTAHAGKAVAMLPSEQAAWDKWKSTAIPRPEGILASSPMLQCPAPDSMGVAFSVTALSAGFAEVADNPEMKGSRRIEAEGVPIMPTDERVHLIRMTGLRPGTRYWYRVGAASLAHPIGYWTKQSEIVWSAVHSFTTPGESAPSHFAMMSDTHAEYGQMARMTAKYRGLGAPFVVWNGDVARSKMNDRNDLVRNFIELPENDGYASDAAIVFNSGNHDYRGDYAWKLDEVIMPRPSSERAGRFEHLMRNFAFRAGEIALIGLDTGEDKPDRHPSFGGLARFGRYRELQAEWLKDQFNRPEIAKAPYIVAFVHIPIFDSDPNANPGNVLEDYAEWQADCAALWGPTLAKNGVQLVMAGHTHKYRFDPATAERPWAQLVGGGRGEKTHQTVVDCRVDGGKLVADVWNTDSDTLIASHRFDPRAC